MLLRRRETASVPLVADPAQQRRRHRFAAFAKLLGALSHRPVYSTHRAACTPALIKSRRDHLGAAAEVERVPSMVISMIAVGEQTGGLDEILSKIADFNDKELDAAVSNLLSLMEPVMIVFLGVVVGGMVVAMYLPILDMINAVATAVRVLPALEADCLRRAMLALASSAGGALQGGGAGAARSATRRSLCGALARCAHAAVRRQAVRRGLIAPLTDLEHALPHRYGADRNGRPPTRRY